MGLLDTMTGVAQDTIDQQPKPLNGTVKAYYDGAVTVETTDGVMENIQCSGVPKINCACLLVPVDDTYVCIPNEVDDTAMIYAMGLGKFSINGDGDLIYSLPIGVENYFNVDSNGDLIVSLDNETNEKFSINDDGDVVYAGL